MAKKDYKDTIVLDPIVDDEIVEDDRMAEERERIEAMSKDEVVEMYLQTKENLWSSHDERDLLEKNIRERDQILAKAQENERELNIKISESMKDNRNLENQLAGARDEIKALKTQAGESSKLRAQVTDLQQQLRDKDNAAKNTQLNLERNHKAETDNLNEAHKAEVNNLREIIKQLEEDLGTVKSEVKTLTAELKKAKKKAGDSEAAADALKKNYLEDDLREELMDEDLSAIDSELDAYIEESHRVLDDLKSKIKTGRAERFEAKKREMENRRAEAEEDKRLENEIREDEEYEAKLRARTEAKKAKKAARAQSK